MEIETILKILIGGGGIGAILSALFNRKDSKEKNKLDLLDRAQIQIARLDARIVSLEARLDKQTTENEELKMKLRSLKEAREQLRREIWVMENERND